MKDNITQDQIDAATEAFGTDMSQPVTAISQLILKERAKELRRVIDLVKPEYHNTVVSMITDLEAKYHT